MLHRLVLTGALLVGLVACSSPASSDDDASGRSAQAGEVFPAVLVDDIEGHPASIVVPGRRYDLLVTGLRDRMDSVSASEAGVDDDASEGTRFVAVTRDLSAAGGEGSSFAGTAEDVSPQLSLLLDGEPTEVGALDEEGVFGWWVAVPEGTDEIGVAIEYDGLTQTVEDVTDRTAGPEGGPDLLYAEDQPGFESLDCEEPVDGPEPERSVHAGCVATITDPLPYHAQLGWPEPGQAWVVARLVVDPVVIGWNHADGDHTSYETDPTDVAVTLDGAEPVELLPAYEPDAPVGIQDDGRWSADAVFSVPADAADYAVAFVQPYTALPDDPAEAAAQGAPEELTGTYEGTFEIDV